MSYAEFWWHYLRAHSRPATRGLHYAGSVLAIATLATGLVTREWLWLLAAPLIGYSFAWVAHLLLEGNRPATFGHPIWSLFSDFRMLGLWLSGRLGPHLVSAGAEERP